MSRVAIENPYAWGSKRISRLKAAQLVRRGKAIWLPNGRLKITDEARLHFLQVGIKQERLAEIEARLEEQREFAKNRGGVVYWNGARSVYERGVDTAMFPPGCNVVYPKVGTIRAAEYYFGSKKRHMDVDHGSD